MAEPFRLDQLFADRLALSIQGNDNPALRSSGYEGRKRVLAMKITFSLPREGNWRAISFYEVKPWQMLPGAAHHFLDPYGQINSLIPEFHPYGTQTAIIVEEGG